jgi:thiamine biosynthesis protein ThiS
MISLVLNGKERQLRREMPIASLLETLGVDRRTVAVARNGDVVPRDTFDRVMVRQGDRIEVVRMVGGG